MPSRNMALKTSDAANRRPNATGAGPGHAFDDRSSLIRHTPRVRPVSVHQTARGARLGPPAVRGLCTLIHRPSPERKKESRAWRLFESLNREASNRVDGATRNPDDWTNELSAVKLK